MFDKDDIITTDKYLSLSSENIVYLKTDLIHRGLDSMIWRGKKHEVRPGLVWITGHSDYSINEENFEKYKVKNSIWYTINKNYRHHKLFALPLGITNDTSESKLHPIYGNIEIMLDIMKQPKQIKNLVYMNFAIKTYPTERRYCHDLFLNKSWVTKGKIENSIKGRKAFLEDIRNHKFVLCPRGNGIDSHRLWETLYMGSIPIVISTIALEEFSDLPILFIESWDILNEDYLNNKYQEITSTTWNMEKLKFGYWKDKILDINSKNLPT